MNNKQVKVYTFTIPANSAFPLLVQSDYFRLQSATGAVDVQGDSFGTLPDLLTGQGLENTPYKRLVFVDKTGAPNTISVLCSGDLFIDNRLNGVVSISNDVGLNNASLLALSRPLAAAQNFSESLANAALTPTICIAPAANVNGAIIHSIDYIEANSNTIVSSFVAKSSAPVSLLDGEVLMLVNVKVIGTVLFHAAEKTAKEHRLAAGKGLYFLSQPGVTGAGNLCMKSVRYTLL